MHQQTIPFKVMCWHTMCTDVSQIEECRNAQWNLGDNDLASMHRSHHSILTTGVHLSNVSYKQLTPREWACLTIQKTDLQSCDVHMEWQCC